MAPAFPSSRLELGYLLSAVEFDPHDANRLVVGGGDGATFRSGVSNKISVLETSSQDELRSVGDVVLSRDEDSVVSLAHGASKGKTTYLYAGMNSGPEKIKAGVNEHLRTLSVEQSKTRASVGAKTPEVKIAELSKTSLFSNPDINTYQRLLRIRGSLGVAATAMGKESQLAVFDTSATTPKSKGVLELPEDAEDIDILQTGDNEYQITFCYKYELHTFSVGKESSDPKLIFTMPDDHGERPKFRSIRYITPNFLVAASNLPKQSGVLIQGFRLPDQRSDMARIATSVRIPRKITATGLAVANLAPPASPTDPVGDTQFIIAVAGHDSSISLYTMNHRTAETLNIITQLYPLYTLKNVHESQAIAGLSFSNFKTPKAHIRAQFIKLASISPYDRTAVVHSIALKKHVDKKPRNPKGPPRAIRYVVAMESKAPSARPIAIFLTISVLIMAIVGQSVMEVFGQSRPILGAHRFLPSWHGTLRSFDPPPAGLLKEDFLAKIAGEKRPTAGETLVMWEGTHPEATAQPDADSDTAAKKLNVDVHDENVHGPGKTWDELEHDQKHAWKETLKEAGAWTQNMGESVFQGILFGEMAGAVGRAVAG
ncbi:hypothetical protein HJFPF1_02719 [Paramyrothecium foliicola]|nr:hypothetical protein HJFPF1_02719 [Paramyrothecium foliicola]